MNTRPARQQALAKQEQDIQNNVRQIEAAKRPSALAMMAGRLNVSQDGLQKTLRNTVFAKANDEEFMALMIVANEYGLNPLTKEIYAFPTKGGGIMPLVSIDGWLRIINEHPQFDGMDHEDIYDENSNFIGVETTIWRKDRTKPIKVMEYLDECKQNTDPWRNMPKRMCRHKSTIQCARYAFGFSGALDGSGEIDGGELTPVSIPQRAELEQATAPETYDPETGEIGEPTATQQAPAYLDEPEPEIGAVLDEIEAAENVIDVRKVFDRNRDLFASGAFDALLNSTNERLIALGGKPIE